MIYDDNIVKIPGKTRGDIMMFTLSTCIWCRKTKELLKNLGVSYRYVDVDLLEGEAAEKVMEDMHKYNPQTSFPTIVIDNGKKVILGFQEEEIRDYLS